MDQIPNRQSLVWVLSPSHQRYGHPCDAGKDCSGTNHGVHSGVNVVSEDLMHSVHCLQCTLAHHSSQSEFESQTVVTRKTKVHTATVETLLFSFPGLRLCGVYPSFRTYGVYLLPCFPRKIVYTIAVCAVRATDREKRGPTVVVYTLFSPVVTSLVAQAIRNAIRANRFAQIMKPLFL